MPGFGQRLKRQRDDHNVSLEDIARRTQIDRAYLEALEREDLAALPGRAFGKFYIRAYAEVLGFDPRELLSEYDDAGAEHGPREAAVEVAADEPRHPWREALRESREQARRAREEALRARTPPATQGVETAESFDRDRPAAAEDAPEPAVVAAIEVAVAETTRSPRSRKLWLPLLGALTLVAAFAVRWTRTDRRALGEETVAEPAASLPVALEEPASASPAPVEHVVREAPPATAATPKPKPQASPPDPQADLTVSEFGVGRRVVGHRLEGAGDRFEEGSVVSFLTRVRGGLKGQPIRHVWFRDGKRVQTTVLTLGGAHWRTYSRKTLWGTGPWAVEARDARERVLARAEFVTVPR